MSNDLYTLYAQGAVEAAARVAFEIGLERGRAEGIEQGRAEGFDAGFAVGFVAGAQSMLPAVADGVRCGSSRCGTALESAKRLGIDAQE